MNKHVGGEGADRQPGDQFVLALRPWMDGIENPALTQQRVLDDLLKIYAATDYGRQHHAGSIHQIDEYRQFFPVVDYEQIKKIIDLVMAGDTGLLLDEEPVGWAITRGTTKGETKFIPMTPEDLRRRVSAGRAVMNYAFSSGKFDIFSGVNLNLNFPSRIGTVRVGDREVEYGYSSGIYTRHVSLKTPVHSVPEQDEIDALGGGKTAKDWDARFELAYERCKHMDVTLVGGVAPTAISFGRYLYRKHRLYPKNIWNISVLTLGSTPGINTRLEPILRALYGGNVTIREIYGATEGMFGQQMDEKRAWVPNYDLFLFEVQTRHGVKMLHEMKPGESGSLIVSTPVLPRYHMGDVILAMQAPYFRCIGREKWWTKLNYGWNEFLSLNFGRL